MKYVLRIIGINKNKGARKIPSAFATCSDISLIILSEKKAVQLPHVTYPLNLPCFHEFLL